MRIAVSYDKGPYDLGAGCFAWLLPDDHWGESNTGLVRFEAGLTVEEAAASIDVTRFADMSEQGRIAANVLNVYEELDPSRPRADRLEQFSRVAAFELRVCA